MLDYIALGLLIVMVTFVIYLVIYIHDIPYEIAKKREHPHCDAIHVAGWVSLFLAHAIWPILWIWAYLYRPGEKFLSVDVNTTETQENTKQLKKLEEQLRSVTQELKVLQAASTGKTPKEVQK